MFIAFQIPFLDGYAETGTTTYHILVANIQGNNCNQCIMNSYELVREGCLLRFL